MSIEVNQGVRLVCSAPWGAHYSLFYKSEENLINLLAQYFKSGIENNEYCIWVTANNDVKKAARKVMSATVPDLDSNHIEERMEFVTASEWYLKSGLFNSDSVSRSWQERLDFAVSHGYEGMRVTGDLGWFDETMWHSLMDYEMNLNGTIPYQRLKVACSYPLEKLNASKLIDVIKYHQRAIAKNNGEWHIFETLETSNLLSLPKTSTGTNRFIVPQGDLFALPVLYNDKCNGCGLCISVCHHEILYLKNERLRIREEGNCDWCTICEAVCPTQAIACSFVIVNAP